MALLIFTRRLAGRRYRGHNCSPASSLVVSLGILRAGREREGRRRHSPARRSLPRPAGHARSFVRRQSTEGGDRPLAVGAVPPAPARRAVSGRRRRRPTGHRRRDTGRPPRRRDANGQITSYVYDSMLRPTEEVKTPDGGQTITTYSSPNAITVANAIVSTTYLFDGLGHLTQTQLTSDPEGTDYTDTSYDTLGGVASVSNPHRSSGSYTDGTTQ